MGQQKREQEAKGGGYRHVVVFNQHSGLLRPQFAHEPRYRTDHRLSY